jgi:small-conductance mechanosensitive channel
MPYESARYTWISGLTDLGIVFLGWILGLLVARFLARFLLRLTRHTETEADDVLIDALSKAMPWFAALFAALVAVRIGPGSPAMVTGVDKVVKVGFVLVITFSLATLLSDLLKKRVLPLGSVGATTLTRKLVYWGVVLAGLVVVLRMLGVEVAPLIAALGVGSLAVGLALQPTLTNVFAGFNLSLARRIRVGDFIRLDGGQEGQVTDIGWRATEIRALGDNIVLVPNARLSELIVTNFSLPGDELGCPVDLAVSYDADLALVERVLLEIARDVLQNVPGGVSDFKPIVLFKGFGESSLPVTCVLRARSYLDRANLIDQFTRRAQARFVQEGIEIPFPQRVVRNVSATGAAAPGGSAPAA